MSDALLAVLADAPDLVSILGDAPSMENLRALARARRDYAETLIQALIDALDSIDPDPDHEPWLGSGNVVPPGRGLPRIRRGPGPERWPMPDHLAFAAEGSDDREEQDEDNDLLDYGEQDTCDAEPSLGAPEGNLYQPLWAGGGDDDRERDDDTEPMLGQPEGVYHNQTLWGRIGGTAHDDEEDHRRHPGYREGVSLSEAV